MATNAVVPFFQQAAVPAELADAFAGASNIAERNLVPSLTFRGKVWRITVAGETHDLMNGEDPKPAVDVVVLAQLPKRSRAFYEGSFVEGESKPPRCWSTDGAVPDAEVQDPCGKTCAACPNAVKGSKVTDNGKAIAACSQFRRLVVVPANDLGFEPLLLRIPQTSIWDKDNAENEQKGFYAWDQYIDMLRARNVNHTASVVTKLRFDKRMAYPKILFGPVRFISGEELPAVKELIDSDKVKALLEMKSVDTYAQQQQAKPPVDDDDSDLTAVPAPALPAKADKAPKMQAAEKPLPSLPTGKSKKPAAAAPTADGGDNTPATAAPAKNSLSSILDDWDD